MSATPVQARHHADPAGGVGAEREVVAGRGRSPTSRGPGRPSTNSGWNGPGSYPPAASTAATEDPRRAAATGWWR